MKKLIVSLRTTEDSFQSFIKAAKDIKAGKKKTPEYRLSFTDPKDFNKFVKNMTFLLWIKQLKPKSVYELAKLLEKDPSNVAKLINFFESYGVISLKTVKKGKVDTKVPILKYDKIEFDLAA